MYGPIERDQSRQRAHVYAAAQCLEVVLQGVRLESADAHRERGAGRHAGLPARIRGLYPKEGFDLEVENFDYLGNAREIVAPADYPEGAVIVVRLTSPLSIKTVTAGQTIQAVLDADLKRGNATIFPKGSAVTCRVVEAKRPDQVSGRSRMVLTLMSIQSGSAKAEVMTSDLSLEGEGPGGENAGRTAAASGAGAVIGAVADGGEGAVRGALIGGVAGLGGVLLIRGPELELPAETRLQFILEKGMTIPKR